MWTNFFVSILCFAFVFGFHKDSIQLSIEYFIYRDIKIVCLLDCKGDDHWGQIFAKNASQGRMLVSKVNINEHLQNQDNIVKCLAQTYSSVGVLVHSQCSGFEEVMNFASSNNMFDAMHKWLIIEDDSNANDSINHQINDTKFIPSLWNVSKAITAVENLNTSVDSDIVIGLQNGYFSYELNEVFNFGKIQGGNLTVNNIGSWGKDTGLLTYKNLNRYKYYDRWDFQQWAMRMIVVVLNPPKHFDPKIIIDRVLAPGVARITQTSAMVLHVVADLHNFRYVYTISDRWVGPYKPENNLIVASALYYGYQDVSPILRMSNVAGKVDFVHPPITYIETRYYYRIPTYGPGKYENQFMRPLRTDSWICIIVVISLCAVALVLSAKLERRPMPGQYAVFSVIASFCQQFFVDSEDIAARKPSQARRIAIFVTGLSFFLIYNYYTSSVVSWLLNGPPPSINSLEELLESPLQLIFEDIGYTRSWLQSPTYYYNKKNAKVEDEIRKRKVFNKKKDAPLLLSVEEGTEMVKHGGFAYHTESDTANLLISRKFTKMELCELGSIPSLEKTNLYTAIPKNSPYKEFLVWSFARLSERGIVSCIQRRTSSAPVSCKGSSPRALALGGAAPAFILLAFGYLLATVIMLIERLVHKRLCLKF